jgi:hypothetical protein
MLKLVADGELDNTDETYTGVTFKLVNNSEAGDVPDNDTVKNVNTALAAFTTAQEWAKASDNSLYPVLGEDNENYGTITNPNSWVEFINGKLPDGYKLVAAFKLGQADATVSTTTDDVYTQNTATITDDDFKAPTDTSTEEAQKAAADIAATKELLFGANADDTKMNATDIKAELENLVAANLEIVPTESTDKDEGGDEGEEEPEEPKEEKVTIAASAVYNVTYTNQDGVAKESGFDDGSVRIYLPFPEAPKDVTWANDKGNYTFVVAHIAIHGDVPEIEYQVVEEENVGKNGVYVNLSSLSTVALMAVEGKVSVKEKLSGAVGGAGNTEPGDGAAAPKDNTGTIIVVGAVAVAAVVGGVIAYNWDKLPVHKIEGTVVDANGAAVANATVELVKDGKVVKTLTTDANGCYSARVAKGEYTITATVGESTATAEGSTGAAAQLAIA